MTAFISKWVFVENYLEAYRDQESNNSKENKYGQEEKFRQKHVEERHSLQAIHSKLRIGGCWATAVSKSSSEISLAVKSIIKHLQSPFICELWVKSIMSHLCVKVRIQVIRLVLCPKTRLFLELNCIDVNPHPRSAPKEKTCYRRKKRCDYTGNIGEPSSSECHDRDRIVGFASVLLSNILRVYATVFRTVRLVIVESVVLRAWGAKGRVLGVHSLAIGRRGSFRLVLDADALRATKSIVRIASSTCALVAWGRGAVRVGASDAASDRGDGWAFVTWLLRKGVSEAILALTAECCVCVIYEGAVGYLGSAGGASDVRSEACWARWALKSASPGTCGAVGYGVACRASLGWSFDSVAWVTVWAFGEVSWEHGGTICGSCDASGSSNLRNLASWASGTACTRTSSAPYNCRAIHTETSHRIDVKAWITDCALGLVSWA